MRLSELSLDEMSFRRTAFSWNVMDPIDAPFGSEYAKDLQYTCFSVYMVCAFRTFPWKFYAETLNNKTCKNDKKYFKQ